MNGFVKCTYCDLNYIRADEKFCYVCNPAKNGHSISDACVEQDRKIHEKSEECEINRKHMEAFYAYRYNRAPKC